MADLDLLVLPGSVFSNSGFFADRTVKYGSLY